MSHLELQRTAATYQEEEAPNWKEEGARQRVRQENGGEESRNVFYSKVILRNKCWLRERGGEKKKKEVAYTKREKQLKS